MWLLVFLILCVVSVAMQLECNTANGWFGIGSSKCYKVFSGANKRSYQRASEDCQQYGAQLVTIKDEYDNNDLARQVENITGTNESFWIGLSNVGCTDLKWCTGRIATHNEGFWSNNNPDENLGECVALQKNTEYYVYDRPYTWSYKNCNTKNNFVCEKMAAPAGSFFCFLGGYIRSDLVCNGWSDCQDESDELNCTQRCRYYHQGANGNLGALIYQNSQVCTWAIETPLGTNAYIELTNFQTEQSADFVTVYVGSIIETSATVMARISGNQGTKQYRSFNNMMFIKFSSDGVQTSLGFTGTYGSLVPNSVPVVQLTAENSPQNYSSLLLGVSNNKTLGMNDYNIVIHTQYNYQLGQMISLEILSLGLSDEDTLSFYNGASPSDTELAKFCNSNCTNHQVIYSTGNAMLILYKTAKIITGNEAFRFRYRQGCYYETNNRWGELFTPGYPWLPYPNFITCTWVINSSDPITIYFESDAQLSDNNNSRVNNSEYLEIYTDSSLFRTGLVTADIQGQVFVFGTGKVTLKLKTSPTRSAKGFFAQWSTGCENPAYDANTIVSTPTAVYSYRSTMNLTCARGYAFQQEQIPTGTTSVTVECLFMGIWKTYKQIPRCTAVYCGDVPAISNGYIEMSSGSVYQSQAVYHCYPRSTLQPSLGGSNNITCQADGRWSIPPSCISASCPNMSTIIENGIGTVTNGDGIQIGSIINFTCNAGYDYVGEPITFCQSNGNWTASPPACKKLTCLLPAITNGQYTGNTPGNFIEYLASASINCNTGYTLENASISSYTCQANRMFSKIPRCININECNTSQPCQGHCYDTDGSYYCTCDTGYSLQADGSSCNNINECALNTDSCDQICTDTPGSYTCSCTLPYVLYTPDMVSSGAYSLPSRETGLLSTDTYYINHTCVLITCSKPNATIPNGKLLTNRLYHKYGDYITYACNIGYVSSQTTLRCETNGDWSASPPVCSAATCRSDVVGSLYNLATFKTGPYNYTEQLSLNCVRPGKDNFTHYRYCTYNKANNMYEMQGSGYDCGTVDCGTPKFYAGTNYAPPNNTLYGASFQFTCIVGNATGMSQAGDQLVRCRADPNTDPYWDFGDLSCFGQTCIDPGYPPDGNIIATSFADKSTVSFTCSRVGYALNNNATLTCDGTQFNGSVPQCVDVQAPNINNCPTAPLILKLYEQLAPNLPSLIVSDNTGILPFTISPANANTTYVMDSNITVTYTVTDYVGKLASCNIQVQVYDETPPHVTCLALQRIQLSSVGDSKAFSLNETLFTKNDSGGGIKSFQLNLSQSVFNFSDLYKTYTYTAIVTDNNNNLATCRSQLFIEPANCSELSFPDPLFSKKNCMSTGMNSLQCVVTCDDRYTFQSGPQSKSINTTCTNGAWDKDWIPACVLDVQKPIITQCLQSQIIEFATYYDASSINLTSVFSNITVSELNNYQITVLPQTFTLVSTDLYLVKNITVTVTDSANNSAGCYLQYVAKPTACSPLSLPQPANGKPNNCTRVNSPPGYKCLVECMNGYVLNAIGKTKEVSCRDGSSWSEIYPACIVDQQPPTVTCPRSGPLALPLANESDTRTIVFASDVSYAVFISDSGGVDISRTLYTPSLINVTYKDLYSVKNVMVSVSDLAGNNASCQFQIGVTARRCSPLSLPKPENGNKNCSMTSNNAGYSCTVKCESGYVFDSTVDTEIVTTCYDDINNGDFNQYIPACVNSNSVVNNTYIGTLRYKYTPTDNTSSVLNGCISYYAYQLDSTSVYIGMQNTIRGYCNVGPSTINVSILSKQTNGSIEVDDSNFNRVVVMQFDYTLYQSNSGNYTRCTSVLNGTANILNSGYTLSDNITGNGTCPSLMWYKNYAYVISTGSYCTAPYFKSLSNSQQCMLCPAGTQSNTVTCSVCPLGTYRSASSIDGCVPCPTGYTTWFLGATSQEQCIEPCSNGHISPSGYAPCYLCAKGYYWTSSNNCTACPSGQTTANVGASSVTECVTPAPIAETCALGTFRNTSTNICQLCPIGTYRNALFTDCISCGTSKSTYVLGAISPDQCINQCSGGLISSDGLPPCTACARGSYYLNSTYCQPCASGKSTPGVGAMDSTACVPEATFQVNCPRGTFRNTTSTMCQKCNIGFYQDIEEQSECKPCGTGMSTYRTGATSLNMCFEMCAPGFYSSTGLSPCTPCGIGKYSSDHVSCAACPSGYITATTTATSIADCIAPCQPGYFSYNGYNQNNACRKCPLNYYQDQTQATSCKQCNPTSKYSNDTGLTSEAQCLNANDLCTNKCSNGGNCTIQDNRYLCQCAQGYYGDTCQLQVNYCLSNPCYNNGDCASTALGYTCSCPTTTTGLRCENIKKTCVTSATNPTCQNGGHCINRLGYSQCLCASGFSGDRCNSLSNICSTNPCNATGLYQCIDVSNNKNLRRKCMCKIGYEGIDCEVNTLECASTPCINGGTCIDGIGTFTCKCPAGYSGVSCQMRTDTCSGKSCGGSTNSTGFCNDNYLLDKPTCICSPGYQFGAYTQYQILQNKAPNNINNNAFGISTLSGCRENCTSQDSCKGFTFYSGNNGCYIWSADPTQLLITTNSYNTYIKYVSYPEDDFWTLRYSLNTSNANNLDTESLTMINNLGLNICGGSHPLETQCCPVGKACYGNSQGTSETCVGTDDIEIQFKCAVDKVFANNMCAVKSDYCIINPCLNGATCSNEFGGYICSCASGYTGRNCQTNINECVVVACSGHGTCTDGVNNYTCNCYQGYEGNNCQTPKNYCGKYAITCNGNGTCVNLIDTYQCQCKTGYEGLLCQNETQNCKSNPCQNGGTCQHRFNDYYCQCPAGWEGKNCETIVKNCLNTGKQCQAQCFDIFNNYYCSCPPNTYGNNCEMQPQPCQKYNKCVNGAICNFTQGNMTCACSAKYTGDGCHILTDYCSRSNYCQNGATCIVNSTGYACQCMPGYMGANCEVEINECTNVSCPGGGKCYDGVASYNCRCPLNMTGDNCGRVVDPNYDLYFNYVSGYAWIPYFVQVDHANFITVSMWVRYAENGGSGVYFTQFNGYQLESSVRFMDFNQEGATIYLPVAQVQLKYSRNAVLNDGNWHIIHLTIDLHNGYTSIYLDTVLQDRKNHLGLIMPNITFRMWLVLGCDFDVINQQCNGSSYHGFLSQLNYYKRELSFNAVNGSLGEISSNFANPRQIFAPMSDIVLVWNEYIYQSGVSRIIPSEAYGESCANPSRTPPCSFYNVTSLPVVSNCSADIVIYSANRVTTVTWPEPTFSNIGSGGHVIKPIYQNGNAYIWGKYNIIYVGVDQKNNTAYCSFTIYVQATNCESPPNPFGGYQACINNDPVGHKGCAISCSGGQFMIDRDHPNLFTCGASGSWNMKYQFKKFRYPSCGSIQPLPKTKIYLRVNYQIGSTACSAVKTNMNARIIEELRMLQSIFIGTLCRNADCSDIQIVITCGSTTGRKRRDINHGDALHLREKRQTYSTLVEVTLLLTDAITTFDRENITARDFLTYFIVGGDILNFSDTIPNAVIDVNSFYIASTPLCPGVGEVLKDQQCVACGPGNYFRYTDSTNTTAICDDCPIGTYQDQYRMTSCNPCDSDLTTEMPGSFDKTACKKSCPVGYFYDNFINDCSPCQIGYYQDEVGQFYCKFCAAGYTTQYVATNASLYCFATCDSGTQLSSNGTCVPCAIGQYRNATESAQCVACPAEFITMSTGGKSLSDCNIAACGPGNFRDNLTNTCQECPLNTYQNEYYQTGCKSCGDPNLWRTAAKGSSAISECLYYCQSGYEVNTTGTNHTCSICPVGYYKDNSVNIMSKCELCPFNKRTAEAGATSMANCTIYKCSVGYYPNPANTGCLECPLGTYQDIPSSTNCTACNASQSTRSIASNTSIACELYCPSGQQKINGSCVSCAVGFYKNNSNGIYSSCVACPAFYTTAGPSANSSEACVIRTCPPGTKRNSNDTGCEPCPIGTYQPSAYQTSCISCPASTSTRQMSSTNFTQCELYCSSGYEMTSTGCQPCAVGYYKNNNDSDGLFSVCKLCPVENITVSNASTSITQCNIGNCSAGYRLNGVVCEACPKGFYQDKKWQTSCIQCAVDKTTQNQTSISIYDCILSCRSGYEDINGTCTPCLRGYYKIENAASACTKCPNGTITEGAGANSSQQCSLPACYQGSYLDRSNSSALVCRQCPYDFFQDQIWQEQCQPCNDGKVTMTIGAISQANCSVNCSSGYQLNHTTNGCELCQIGYYRDQSDRAQMQCQMCPIAFITEKMGSPDLRFCSIANCTTPGYYRNTTTNMCQKCAIGEYSSLKWATACIKCPEGNTTKYTGSTTISDCRSVCPLGQYVGTDNYCYLCPRGSYRSDTTVDNCTMCSLGLLTAGAGAMSPAECNVSRCLAGEKYVVDAQMCVKCELGTYQPNNGSFLCISCNYTIKYTPKEGATSADDCKSPCNLGQEFNPTLGSCVPCPVGYYQSLSNQFTCLKCPDKMGYTAATGATNSSQCVDICKSNVAKCSANATCTANSTATGHTCTCFDNYDDVLADGSMCIHKCDRGYCQNGATCNRDPSDSNVICVCTQWYEGNTCQSRLKAEQLSNKTVDIIVPVIIAGGGLIVILIAIALCCLCRNRNANMIKKSGRYSEFHGDRFDKTSVVSYGQQPYLSSSRTPSRLMLAPHAEMVYDNAAYVKPDQAVYEA